MAVTPFPGRTPRPAWWNLCILNEKGRPVPNYFNACIALEHDQTLIDSFAYDDMLRIPMLMRGIPGVIDDNAGYPRPVTDKDVGDIQKWMQDQGITSISHDNVHRAVFNRSEDCKFHPVLDWMDSLCWDGEARIDVWLMRYLGVKPAPYTAMVSKYFLMQMVARIFEPGCQADYMLILEGDQGILKSNALEILAGEWFSDDLPDISTAAKDAAVHLRGKWLIEISELHAFSKAESTHLKSFVSRRVERFRPPYGRAEVIEPRQCCFAGTTNKELYLKDETGGRRFWPIKCGEIKLDELREVRNQLFAEAIVAYKSGLRYWPTPEEERAYFKAEQELRYDGDIWEDLIRDYVKDKTEVTIKQIAVGCLDYCDPKDSAAVKIGKTSFNRFGTADQNRVKRALQSLGWLRSGKSEAGVIFRTRKPVG